MTDCNYVNYAVYDTATGRILRYGACPAEQVALQSRVGQWALLLPACSPSPVGHYVADGVLVPQTVLAGFDTLTIAADGVARAVMVVPDPCEVWIDDVLHRVAGGVLALTADHPGVYVVTIDHPRHLPFEARITAR